MTNGDGKVQMPDAADKAVAAEQELTPEQKERHEKIKNNAMAIMELIEGELVTDAIATLKTCEGIVQAGIRKVNGQLRVEKEDINFQ